MSSTYIESKTAYKIGWGSSWWRSVHGLLQSERQAVRKGHHVWFSFRPWHYTQSGYKMVTVYQNRFDSREPTQEELQAMREEMTTGVHRLA